LLIVLNSSLFSTVFSYAVVLLQLLSFIKYIEIYHQLTIPSQYPITFVLMNTSLSMIHRNIWKKRSNIWWNQRLHRCLSLFTYLMKQNLSVAWSWTKKSLKTPALWTEFFECIHKKKGMLHVLCRYCHRSYAHPSKIGKDTANGNQNLNGPITSMSW